MIAYLIALGVIVGTVAIGMGVWAWRAGHSTEMWQQYRMTDAD